MDNLAKLMGFGDRQFESVRLCKVPEYATFAHNKLLTVPVTQLEECVALGVRGRRFESGQAHRLL